MLTYLASGERDYSAQPIEPYARWTWEVFAVQEGSVRLWLRNGVQAAREKTFWVFPPGYFHGWQGGLGKARVTIFLLEDLPDPVGTWVTEQGWLALPLSPSISLRFQEIHDWAESQWMVFDGLRELRWKRLVHELAVLIGEQANTHRLARYKNKDAFLVESAIRLFAEHLSEGWNLEQVCKELPVSLAQLRRLFTKVLRASPREIFEDIRSRRAMELIMAPHAKLETVAFECGYQSIAAFSRAFKRRCSISPSQWQKDESLRHRAQKRYDDFRWFDQYETRLQFARGGELPPKAK